MNNLLCITILKILIFLRFFQSSRFLKNFQLLKSIRRWQNPLCTDLTSKSQQRPKSIIKLLIIKQKWNYTYLILTNNLLTSTIREVRRNSKENFPVDIGTSRIKVTVVNCFYIPIHTVLCRHSLQMWMHSSWSFQRDALADKVQAYLFP